MTDFNDNAILIKSLKKGEEKAYVFLVDYYHKRLYAYALNLIGDYAMAQDILQNVFLNTWRHRAKLNTKYSIESFLYRAVYNEFINEYRKNKAITLLEQKYLDSLDNAVYEIDEGNLHKMTLLVTKEVEKLPTRCKQIFILSRREGLTNIEISKHLNISIKTVEGHITKSFKILRKKLGDEIHLILFLIFPNWYNSIMIHS